MGLAMTGGNALACLDLTSHIMVMTLHLQTVFRPSQEQCRNAAKMYDSNDTGSNGNGDCFKCVLTIMGSVFFERICSQTNKVNLRST